MTGIKVPSDGDPPQQDVVRSSALTEEELRYIEGKVREVADGVRRFRKYLQLYPVGPGADSVTPEEVVIDKVVSSLRTVISLRELSIKFTISQRQVEYSRARSERVYSNLH